MIFQHTYQLILDNEKTETRRLINPGEKLLDNPRCVEVNGRAKWQVGRSYAIQPGRGKKAVGRIKITGIKTEPLDQMSEEDALAEGFQSLDSFRQAWMQCHGNFEPDLSVWVLTFARELTPEEQAKTERLRQEKRLNQMAFEERKKLTIAGHELSEWKADGDLKWKAKCSRCGGSVATSVGEMNVVMCIPLMNADECFADNLAQMEAANKEWHERLARVYSFILSRNWTKQQPDDVEG
jgi:hypothetical protein